MGIYDKRLSDEERFEEDLYRRQHYSKFGVLGADYIHKYDTGEPIEPEN